MSYTVQLYVYDISKGAARALSAMLIGKQIDGIWHTGLVCFGKEYFFGSGGIESIFPGTTVLGRPDEIITLGETQITEEVFNEYLFEIYPQFSPDKYHLFNHNCNTFSDEASQFLTGKKIPSYIQDLPREVLSTDFGSMLKDIFESAVTSPSADGVIQRFLGNEEGATSTATSNSSNQLTSSTNQVSTPSATQSTSTIEASKKFRPQPDSQGVTYKPEVEKLFEKLQEKHNEIADMVIESKEQIITCKEECREALLNRISSSFTNEKDIDGMGNDILLHLLMNLTNGDPCLLVDSPAGISCLEKILSLCSNDYVVTVDTLKLMSNISSSVASRKLLNNAGSSSSIMSGVLSFCSSQLLNESDSDCVNAAITATHNLSFGNVPSDSALEMSSALLHVTMNTDLKTESGNFARRAITNLCRQNPEVIELANMMGFTPEA